MSKAEKTRQYIIEKAAPVFNKKGFAGTSLSDLTEITGLTKGSIYGNFKNKDEIALAAFDYNVEKITEGLVKELEGKTSAIEKLLVIPAYYRKAYQDKLLKVGCPIVNAGAEADDTHPRLRQKVNAAISRFKKGLEKMILEGIEHKEIKKEVNAEQHAMIIISLIEGGIMLAKSTQDNRFLNVSLDKIEWLILQELKS